MFTLFAFILVTMCGVARGTIPAPVGCFPHAGEENHAPMPNFLPMVLPDGTPTAIPQMGWWYLSCNANEEDLDTEDAQDTEDAEVTTRRRRQRVGVEIAVFEMFVPGVNLELLTYHTVISLPDAAPSKNFYSTVSHSLLDANLMPWGQLPVSLSVGPSSTIRGDADHWNVESSGIADQTGQQIAVSMEAKSGPDSFRMIHNNNTGCYDYGLPFMNDVFYMSNANLEITRGSYVMVPKDDGNMKKLKMRGTCHYDRQSRIVLSAGFQWEWGQALFGDVPDMPILSNANVMWFGVYGDPARQIALGTHLGIKTQGGELIEWRGVGTVILNRLQEYVYPANNVSFSNKINVQVPSAGISFTATAAVENAVIPTPADPTLPPQFQTCSGYFETVADYTLGTDPKIVGTGFIEVTTGLWPPCSK